MIYLQLLWSFMKIGFTSFGGLSMIPLITSEMLSHQWMTAAEVSDIVAIAEMTPGPLGLNCATFAGMRTAGIIGAICANFGVLMPTFTVGFAAAIFLERFRSNKTMEHMLKGIRPACIGLIIGLIVQLLLSNYIVNGSLNVWTMLIGAMDLALLMKYKVSIPKVIVLSGILGVLLFGVLG